MDIRIGFVDLLSEAIHRHMFIDAQLRQMSMLNIGRFVKLGFIADQYIGYTDDHTIRIHLIQSCLTINSI